VHGQPLSEFTPGSTSCWRSAGPPSSAGHSVFLLGSAPGVAEEAGEELSRRFPRLKIVGTGHGYFKPPEEPSVIRRVRQNKPSLLFVGMGMPAQEKWIARHLKVLGVPVVMGVGEALMYYRTALSARPPGCAARDRWLFPAHPRSRGAWRRILQLPVFAWKVWREKHSV